MVESIGWLLPDECTYGINNFGDIPVDREIWRPIIGLGGKYEISNFGNIYSVPRVDRGRKWGGYLVKLSKDRDGYCVFTVRGVSSTRVHRLVLEAFSGKNMKDMIVRHLNGNPSDNRLENLRWGTNSENVRDSIAHGTYRPGKFGRR